MCDKAEERILRLHAGSWQKNRTMNRLNLTQKETTWDVNFALMKLNPTVRQKNK